MEDKIFNNRFNNVEYGSDRTAQADIAVHPAMSSVYAENVSDNIEAIYVWKKLMEQMDKFYHESEFYEKYGNDCKKIERGDYYDIYYYFKDRLTELEEYNTVQICCAICEYFELNYNIVYRDILSLADKVEVLDSIEDQFGLDKPLQKSKKLF